MGLARDVRNCIYMYMQHAKDGRGQRILSSIVLPVCRSLPVCIGSLSKVAHTTARAGGRRENRRKRDEHTLAREAANTHTRGKREGEGSPLTNWGLFWQRGASALTKWNSVYIRYVGGYIGWRSSCSEFAAIWPAHSCGTVSLKRLVFADSRNVGPHRPLGIRLSRVARSANLVSWHTTRAAREETRGPRVFSTPVCVFPVPFREPRGAAVISCPRNRGSARLPTNQTYFIPFPLWILDAGSCQPEG